MNSNVKRISLWVLIISGIFTLISGLFACTWMIKLVKSSKLSYFAIYCIVVGFIAITYASLN
jgi:undecaprenyl-diphosphatase